MYIVTVSTPLSIFSQQTPSLDFNCRIIQSYVRSLPFIYIIKLVYYNVKLF